MHKQTNRQTDRHYKNNDHLAVNQKYEYMNSQYIQLARKFMASFTHFGQMSLAHLLTPDTRHTHMLNQSTSTVCTSLLQGENLMAVLCGMPTIQYSARSAYLCDCVSRRVQR